MITKENLEAVINLLPAKTKKRIQNTNKEFCVLYLYCTNAGAWSVARLTNDFQRYSHVSKDGNCILYTDDVQQILAN